MCLNLIRPILPCLSIQSPKFQWGPAWRLIPKAAKQFHTTIIITQSSTFFLPLRPILSLYSSTPKQIYKFLIAQADHGYVTLLLTEWFGSSAPVHWSCCDADIWSKLNTCQVCNDFNALEH